MFTKNKNLIQLFIVSFLILFLEIAIIRWISTEVRIFAYLNNLVLLSCFLGIGAGCYLSDKKIYLSLSISMLSALIMFVNLPFTVYLKNDFFHIFRDIPFLLTAFTDSVVWHETVVKADIFTVMLGMAATLVIFFTIALIFFSLGQLLGRFLAGCEDAVKAYSVNIMASIIGVIYFSRLSFLYTPPWLWFVVSCGAFTTILLSREKKNLPDFVSIVLCVLLIVSTMLITPPKKFGRLIIWSPYQKLEFHSLRDMERHVQKGYVIDVNNVGYMTLLDSQYFDEKDKRFNQYDLPYLFKEKIKDVLILGAGAGNDAAGALRNGIRTIDAVEIDPAIYKLGLNFHPESPYSNPSVNMKIGDARPFLKRSNKKYDMVCFGLLDSHTLSSSYNNMRLDHYVYTKESILEAKGLLNKDGVLTLTFWVQRDWVGKRIANLLKEAFRIEPIIFSTENRKDGLGIVMFVIGNNMPQVMGRVRNTPGLEKFIEDNKVSYKASPRLTTDNWPYLYLGKPGIPRMHIFIMIVLLALLVLLTGLILPKGKPLDKHFLFLGAGFLLLEFQNISKSALLFGSTWMVNTFTISAILVLSLLANLFVQRFKIQNIKLYYALLIASLLVVFFIPLRMYNFLGYYQKSIIVSFVLNLPVFFAGVIFTVSFKKTSARGLAFGSNFIGAALGGILESLSFITGINALVLVCTGLYILSFVFIDKQSGGF